LDGIVNRIDPKVSATKSIAVFSPIIRPSLLFSHADAARLFLPRDCRAASGWLGGCLSRSCIMTKRLKIRGGVVVAVRYGGSPLCGPLRESWLSWIPLSHIEEATAAIAASASI